MSYRDTPCSGVLLIFPNGERCPLFPRSPKPEDVLSDLTSLAQIRETTYVRIPGISFRFKLPSCYGHVFVAFSPKSNGFPNCGGEMEVYAIEVPETGHFTKEDLQNQFGELFGPELLHGMELKIQCRGERDHHNEESNVLPSGTVLLAVSLDQSRSRSSSCELSPEPFQPQKFPSHPEMEQNTNHNLCVNTVSPSPPQSASSSNIMVSGNSNFPIPIPQNAIPVNGEGSFRRAPPVADVQPMQLSLLQDTGKPQIKSYGDTDLLGIAIETPANEDKPPLIQVTSPVEKLPPQERNETDSPDIPQLPLNGQMMALQDTSHNEPKLVINEQCSLREENKLKVKEMITTNSATNVNSQQSSDPRPGNSDMVIGRKLDRVDMAKADQLAVPGYTRRTSSFDSFTTLRRDSLPESVNPSDDENGRPPLSRAKSLPTKELKAILAGREEAQEVVPCVQRQDSTVYNETIMEGTKPKLLSLNKEVLSTHVEELEPESKIFHVGGDENDASELSDVPVPVPVEDNVPEKPAELLPSNSSPTADPCPPSPSNRLQEPPVVSDRTEEASSKSEEMWQSQVHFLEHACNGACPKGVDCELTPRQAESVEQMKEMVADVREREKEPCDILKKAIISHCTHCWDVNCKVPHRAAGCLPPGDCVPTSSSSEGSDTPYTPPTESTQTPPTSLHPIGAVSVDVDANMSTTSMVQEFLRGPTACTDELEGNIQQKPLPLQLHQRPPRISAIQSPMVALRRRLYQTSSPDDSPHYVPHLPASTLGQTSTMDMTATGVTRDRRNCYMHNYYDAPRRLDRSNFPESGSRYAQFPDGASTRPVYIQHNHEATARMRSRIEPASPSLPEIGKGGFSSLKDYATWIDHSRGIPDAMIIYSNENEAEARRLLVAGLRYPRPSTTRINDEIDKGGNGRVFNYVLQGQTLAVKQTRYRQIELNMWYKLKHPNIVPLYGVMLHDHLDCFQIMPKMTTNLRKVLRQCGGGLHSLLKQEGPDIWEKRVYPNAVYIFREILCGLKYLHANNIQHCDMKAANILILVKCKCPDILHCTCSIADKYEVRIADFDSVKESKYPIIASKLPTVEAVAKTVEEMGKVMGTKTYRAPEQFQLLKRENHAYKKEYEGCPGHVYNLEGPHCDMWSLGCIITQFCIGALNPQDKVEVSIINNSPQSTDITPLNEGTLAFTRYKRLSSACLHHQELIEFGKLADACIELDFKKRPTAEDLLKFDIFECLNGL